MCNIYILVIKNVFNLFNINISFSRCVLSRHYFNKLLTFFFPTFVFLQDSYFTVTTPTATLFKNVFLLFYLVKFQLLNTLGVG